MSVAAGTLSTIFARPFDEILEKSLHFMETEKPYLYSESDNFSKI